MAQIWKLISWTQQVPPTVCLYIQKITSKRKVNSVVFLSKSFNEVLWSGYIGGGRRREEGRCWQPEKNGQGFHREKKGVVISFNKFTRVWRRHNSDSVVQTRITCDFFLNRVDFQNQTFPKE